VLPSLVSSSSSSSSGSVGHPKLSMTQFVCHVVFSCSCLYCIFSKDIFNLHTLLCITK